MIMNNNTYFILSDLHIGKPLPDNGERHLKSIYYLLEEVAKLNCGNNSKHICVICGDLFDSRLKISSKDIIEANNILAKMYDIFDKIYLVTGNHDMFTSSPGAPNILDIFSNDKTIVVKSFLHNEDGVFIPFDDPILNDNESMMENWDSDSYCFCHQAIEGIAPPLAEHIVPNSIFKGFKMTIAGHIHIRKATANNVISIGTPSSFTFADVNTTTFGGLYIDEKGESKFIDSPYYLKYKVFNINKLADLKILDKIDGPDDYCVKLTIDESVFSQVCSLLDVEKTSKFTLFKYESLSSIVQQSTDMCDDLHTGDANSIISIIRKEFEGNEDTLKVFNNIVDNVLQEINEKEQ